MVDLVVQRGSVQALHDLDPFADGPPDRPVVWWCRPTDDAIVLGSRQATDMVDTTACRRAGLTVVHRRSGGGAVVMRRGRCVWVDVILPTGAAPDDVRGSMVWIGHCWRNALEPLVDGPLAVHDGGMLHTQWSRLVCFAGIGPGELLAGGRKLVGLSQRRTRHGIRVQALLYRAPAAHEYRPLLLGDLPPGDPADEAGLAGVDGATLAGALARALGPS